MEVIDLEKMKKLIRALLISCPRGMPAAEFAADFRNTMGRPIPFNDFGCKSLDDFIRSIPDVVKVLPGPNGEKYYYGVATAETQHVARLVATQKKPSVSRSSKPSACVRPSGFTRKGLVGPRARQGGPARRAPPRFNRHIGNHPAQHSLYRPSTGHPLAYKTPDHPKAAVLVPAGAEHLPNVSLGSPVKAKQSKTHSGATPDQAVKQLSPKGSQSRSLLEMVRQLLEEKPNGVWAKRLKKELESKFKGVEIPEDISTQAMDMPFVQTECPIPSNPIMYLKKTKKQVDSAVEGKEDSSSDQKGETEWPSFTSPSTSLTDTRLQTKSLPSTVQLDEEFFDVIVTCINSPIDFYVQKSDNEKLLSKWQDDLLAYFSSNVPKAASSVVPNGLYAYLLTDTEKGRSFWCRVLTVSCTDQEADVVLPDYGYNKVLLCKDLKELPSQFSELPFQAVQCSLHGVSDTSETAILKFTELADQELCVAQVMNSSGHRYALELICNNSEPGAETINSTILKLSQPISSLKPLLPNPGEPAVPVKLTDVDEDGILSVQLVGPGLTYLDQLLTEMNNPNSRIHKDGKPMGFITQRSVGTICCTPFLDGTWYRAQIKKIITLKRVLVEFVDFGNEEEVDLNTTTLILPPPSELFSLPFQAVKCTLHGVPPGSSWNEAGIELLSEYIESGELLLQVIQKPENDRLASVKLYCLTGDDEEESQIDLGEYLLSQEAFNQSSMPAMKIMVSGQPESKDSYMRKVLIVQEDCHSTMQGPAPKPQKSGARPTESPQKGGARPTESPQKGGTRPTESPQKGGARPIESPALRISSTKSSDLSDSNLIDSGIQSLQITVAGKITAGPSSPPLTSLAAPQSPVPLYNITSSPITTPTPGLTTPHLASPFHSPQSSKLKVPPSDVSLQSPRSPLTSPPTTPLTSPPSASPRHSSNTKQRLFGSEAVAVLVTAVKSPDHFTVQLLSEQHQLEQLVEMLQHTTVTPVEQLEGTSDTKRLYCAQYSDHKRYRCQVTELLPNDYVKVEFVDYGDEMVLHISALHTLPLSLSGLPVCGITCVLGGVQPSEGKWSDSALAFFTERVLNKQFFALFKEQSCGAIHVALIDETQVVDDLVLKGFAKSCVA